MRSAIIFLEKIKFTPEYLTQPEYVGLSYLPSESFHILTVSNI